MCDYFISKNFTDSKFRQNFTITAGTRAFLIWRFKMIKGEAKVLETDVVIFPMKPEQNVREKALSQEKENNFVNEKKAIETDNESRFARLKKSLRKRSASIL